MREELKAICRLQPSYSSETTPEMRERGETLRRGLKPKIEALRDILAPELGRFGEDFFVEAKDGQGRKTELPWLRFCSRSMSPSATIGFYFVIHFSTDGSAVHFTIGCGSSVYSGGEFVVQPDEVIDKQTAWARGIIKEAFGDMAPFLDKADFGARRPLPLAFQRATAVSKRIAYDDIDGTDLDGLLVEATRRLRAIYVAQAQGRDLTPAALEEAEIDVAIRPLRSGARRQGLGLTAPERRAVELRAMAVATEYFEVNGYEVTDTSSNQPFDLEIARNGLKTKVEVKGTTSDGTDMILMTRNEVDLHRSERGETCLVIVCRIRLDRTSEPPGATDGEAEILMGWDIDDWQIEPTAFRLTKRN